jgi:hypothetical protein
MHYGLFALILAAFMYSFAASSSSAAGYVDHTFSRDILENHIINDEHKRDTTYKRTIAMLHQRNYGNANFTFPFAECYSSESGALVQYQYIYLSPLQCALKLRYYNAAIAMIKAFPQHIDGTDICENTLLHYLSANTDCACNSRCDECLPPRELLKLLNHQINIPNQLRTTPIFLLDNPHLLALFMHMGAHIDAPSIHTLRPSYWYNDDMLGALHYLGFSSDFLAATFEFPKAKIHWASKSLAPALAATITTELLIQKQQVLGATSMHQTLQMREQVGRLLQPELRRLATFERACTAARQESEFRMSEQFELLDQYKRERTDDRSADGTKRQRTT